MKATLIVIVLAASGCEYVETVEGTISLDRASCAEVLMVWQGAREPLTSWDPVGARGEQYIVDFSPGALSYRYSLDEIGGFGPVLYLGAFLDLDGDGALSATEPFGAYTGNPITDVPGGWFDVEPAVADLAISVRTGSVDACRSSSSPRDSRPGPSHPAAPRAIAPSAAP